MKLLTVGDSFTYGEELADQSSAWPILLGNKLGYEVTNLARPASGNTRMVRYIIENINNFDTFIIAWSHFARTEIADENGIYDIWPGCSIDPHKQQMPWRGDLINYYSRHHNDSYLYRQYLINVILLQQYLKNNDKKCLMLDAFENHQDKRRLFPENNDLIKQIDTSIFLGWPYESMMEWANGVPKGPGGHFLEQGHEIVADKIYEYIRHLGWIS
jgi:lysophospholipase L1-like esterase